MRRANFATQSYVRIRLCVIFAEILGSKHLKVTCSGFESITTIFIWFTALVLFGQFLGAG